MTTPSRSLKELFLAALEVAPADRAAWLELECASDDGLRAHLGLMLAAHDAPQSLLDRPGAAKPFAGAVSAGGVGPTVDQPLGDVPGTIIGPYKLLEQIGEGGFGVVFMAEQTEPVRRKVALKILKAGMDTRQVVARFEAERQALAIMDHPNIARVFDGGSTEPDAPARAGADSLAGASGSGRPYFVMELVKGMPITDFCDQHHLTPWQRLELFIPVCHAVQHAHQKGIIHRDLKPSNILVTVHDTTPAPKVIDFGVAKALGQELTDKTLFTGFAQMIGTPLYVSPEQAGQSGLDVDTRSDVYSLGVVLYELLTGTTPFSKERFKKAAYDEIRRIIREEDPPKPSTRLSELGSPLAPREESGVKPPTSSLASVAAMRHTEPAKLTRLVRGELDWIVMKAMEKDRNRRYETANGFAMDVQRYLADEPVLACPPSAGYRIRKFLRRNKGPVWAAAVVLLTLLGGIVGTTVGLVRAEQRAEGERQAKQEAQAVLDFVEQKILATARPEGQAGGLGHDVTLRRAIEAALPYVDASFKDQPLIEGRLRLTLAMSFHYLGENRIAAEQAESARALYVKHRGPEHHDTLVIIEWLATCYNALDRHEEALQLREQTLRLQRSSLGRDHPDTLASLVSLAHSYNEFGRYADAVKLCEETLPMMKAKFPNHTFTMNCIHTLANGYADLGRFDEALKLWEESLALRKAKFGLDHPDTLKGIQSLAYGFRSVGRNAEALKLWEETLAIQKAKLPADHPDLLSCMMSLANSYDDNGRHDDALKLNEQVVALQTAKLGPDHTATLGSKVNLASSYYELGRHADAIKLDEETLPVMRAKLPRHPFTFHCMHNLAASYASVGRHAEAKKLHAETLALRKAHLGPDHPDTIRSMHDLGCSHWALGQRAEALKLHQEIIALRKAKFGPDHPDVIRSMAAASECLLLLDRGAEAVPLIDECVRRAPGTQLHPRLIAGLIENRLRYFEKTKDAAGCRTTAEMLENLKRTDADGLYQAARLRSVAAAVVKDDPNTPAVDAARLAREDADQAIAWLRKAVAAGYQNVDHLKKDADLDALREREDFKALLAELEAKSKP